MTQQTGGLKQRSIERAFLLLVSIVLALFFLNLYTTLQKGFGVVPQRLADGTMINLNAEHAARNFKNLLQKEFYFEDTRDIGFAATAVEKGLNTTGNTLDNIGELNKRLFDVDAANAFSQGGDVYKKRVRLSRSLLGFTGRDSVRFEQEKKPTPMPALVNIGSGKYAIDGSIKNADGAPVTGVLVRLTMLLPEDSIYSNSISDVARQTTETTPNVIRGFAFDSANNRQLQSLVSYARTDNEGNYAFQNLPQNKAFEILPLQPDFQFGPSKGTSHLESNETFSFVQQPHKIRLLSSRDFNNLKREKALIVRTPQEFNWWFWIIVGGFFLSFFLLHFFLSFRLPHTDGILLPLLMLLTGFFFYYLIQFAGCA